MFVTVASHKGGVAKTTTAVHLADYFNSFAPTLLLDADPTKNALDWYEKGREGKRLPFRVAPDGQGPKLASQYTHIVIDKGQRPTMDDLKTYAGFEADELLIVPTVPAPCDVDGLMRMVATLQEMGAKHYRVLLTRVPVDAAKDATALREALVEMGVPIFQTQIPRLKTFERAAGEGTVAKHINDKTSERAWKAYVDAGKEILQ